MGFKLCQIKKETSTGSTYTKWLNYYSGDTVRLYATYSGGESEVQSDGTTSDENKYVEFRIIQVGEHDSDGSAVTFMATNLLPTAYAHQNTATNAGGWSSSLIRPMLQSGGSIYTKFSGNFTGNIHTTAKYSCNASGSVKDQGLSGRSSTNDQFFLLAYSEMGTGDAEQKYPKYDGGRYQYFTDTGLYYGKNTDVIKLTTRAGKWPRDQKISGKSVWWTRARTSSQTYEKTESGTTYFYWINYNSQYVDVNDGNLADYQSADYKLGVALCFAM